MLKRWLCAVAVLVLLPSTAFAADQQVTVDYDLAGGYALDDQLLYGLAFYTDVDDGQKDGVFLYTVPAIPPAKDGFAFDGWVFHRDANGATGAEQFIFPGDAIESLDLSTHSEHWYLTARWTAAPPLPPPDPTPVRPVDLFLNDQQITTDVPPMIIAGRTMVPLRVISETLGCEVQYYGDGAVQARTAFVKITGETVDIDMTIGVQTVLLNDQATQLDVASQIVDGRTMVPLRFVAEAFGLQVVWQAGEGPTAHHAVRMMHTVS